MHREYVSSGANIGAVKPLSSGFILKDSGTDKRILFTKQL